MFIYLPNKLNEKTKSTSKTQGCNFTLKFKRVSKNYI